MTEYSGHTTGPAYATLQDYLRLLRRQRWLIIAVSLIFAAAALALSVSRESTYTAEASLAFRDVNQDLPLFGDSGGVPEQAPGERAAVNSEVVTRPEVARTVKRRLGTDVSEGSLQGAISTRVDTLTNLVLVQARWGSAEFAARLANAFAQEAVRVSTREQRRVVDDAIQVLERRLEKNQGDPNVASVTRQQLIKLEAIRAITRPARIVRRAEVPATPSGPNTVRNTGLGLIVGIAVGLLIAFLRDSLDRRLRGSRDVREELDLPVLGRVAEDVLGHPGLAENGRGEISEADFEAFRVLRTNLQFLHPGGDLRSILITSGMPEEGKSTTAVSLASAAAIAGRRTLLVECDLRRPSLAERIGINEKPGLHQYLTGEASPQEVLQVVPLAPPGANGGSPPAGDRPKLVCIAAGGSSPDSAELLGSERFRSFLSSVTDAYELVVIDCSPLLSVVDPLELIPQVDGVIVCVRLAQTTRDEARATKAALGHLPERPTGVVVTGARAGDADSYSYYGYGYSA
jgi:capsular exopolysaccharide synthesis family protein